MEPGNSSRTRVDELVDRLSHHPPPHAGVARAHEAIREGAKIFGKIILQHVPCGQDQDRAVELLHSTMNAANTGIACNGDAFDEGSDTPRDQFNALKRLARSGS